MDLTKKQMRQKAFYQQFAKQVVEPAAKTIDQSGVFPYQTLKKMRAAGFFSAFLPKHLGGEELDSLTFAICIEELAKVCAATAITYSTHVSLCSETILQFGTPQQIKQFLLPLSLLDKIGAFALTEPHAGSDLSAIKTTAICRNKHYHLNGTKCFITNGSVADIYLVFAQLVGTEKKNALSAFIVTKNAPGFTVGRSYNKLGIRGSDTAEIKLSDCIIAEDQLLACPGEGLGVAKFALNNGRLAVAAQAVGIATGALEQTIDYVKNRVQFNKPIAAFQNTKFQLAAMNTQIQAARQLTYHGSYLKGQQQPYEKAASEAKLFASETAMQVTQQCLQLFGGNGYLTDYPIERMFRDAKITEIYEGTNEIQRMIIANHLLNK